MSYFTDANFRERMLALLTRDRRFLRKVSGLLSAADFRPTKDEQANPEAWARHEVSRMALVYYREYRQPIGGLLRTEALDLIREQRNKLSKKQKEELLNLVERLKEPELGVAPDAIEKKIVAYKRRQALKNAIDEMLTLQQKGELTVSAFQQVTRKAVERLASKVEIVDYGAGIMERIKRREAERDQKYPYLFIDPFDEKVRSIPRGMLGLVLAKYKVGKSAFMVHLAQAYAVQGYNVLFFTLEDPLKLVEDKLDGSLSGLAMTELAKKPKTLRRNFLNSWERMRANIHLVDATGGGWTVQRMVDIAETQRNRGIPTDAIIIDYDEQIEPETHYKSDSALRLQSQETYLALTRWAARDQVFMWTAAQATIPKLDKMIITGEDTAEDKSKMRKVGLALGLGMGPKELDFDGNCRYLYVAAHKFGKQKIGWPIVGDYAIGMFYDREKTEEALKLWQKIERVPQQRERRNGDN